MGSLGPYKKVTARSKDKVYLSSNERQCYVST
jgi:hypothetical protein